MKKDVSRTELVKSFGEFEVMELEDAFLEQVRGGDHIDCGCHDGCECNINCGTRGCGVEVEG